MPVSAKPSWLLLVEETGLRYLYTQNIQGRIRKLAYCMIQYLICKKATSPLFLFHLLLVTFAGCGRMK